VKILYWLVVSAIIFAITEVQGAEARLTLPVASYHLDRTQGYNERNYGVGIEYTVATDLRLKLDDYKNSFNRNSIVAGAIYTPLDVKVAHLGAILAVVNGYAMHNNGGFFPALIPVISFDRWRVGANVFYAPKYKDGQAVWGFELMVKF